MARSLLPCLLLLASAQTVSDSAHGTHGFFSLWVLRVGGRGALLMVLLNYCVMCFGHAALQKSRVSGL